MSKQQTSVHSQELFVFFKVQEWIHNSRSKRRDLERELIQIVEYVQSPKFKNDIGEKRSKLLLKVSSLKNRIANSGEEEAKFLARLQVALVQDAGIDEALLLETVRKMIAMSGLKAILDEPPTSESWSRDIITMNVFHAFKQYLQSPNDQPDLPENLSSIFRRVQAESVSNELLARFLSSLALFRFTKWGDSKSVSSRIRLLRVVEKELSAVDRKLAFRSLYDESVLETSENQCLTLLALFEQVCAYLDPSCIFPLKSFYLCGLVAMNIPCHSVDKCGVCPVCHYTKAAEGSVSLPYCQKSHSILTDSVLDCDGAVLLKNGSAELFPQSNVRLEMTDEKTKIYL